jgi:type III secretion system YscD/HrpQ family protein
MAGKLVIEEGERKGSSLSLEEGDAWVIGRDPDEAEFVIEDPSVSRKHLLIKQTPEGLSIENLSETNQAEINDEELAHEPRLLQNGDLIKIGGESIRYYEESTAQVMGENEDEIGNLVARASEAYGSTAPPLSDSPYAPKPEPEEEEEEIPQNSLFEEDESHNLGHLAEIDFGIAETGRWLLKVIGGPNNGAEFYMQTGHSYTIGTDPKNSDIVFHDTSVSRQHAKLSVNQDETLTVEDLKSRNGVLINGVAIKEKEPLPLNTIVTMGTTSFVVYDREGEMQTIISPLLPSIVKVLQQEPSKKEAQPAQPETEDALAAEPLPASSPKKSSGSALVIGAVIALFLLAGLGTTALFRSEPVVTHVQENAEELIHQTLAPYPAVHYTYNKANGGLLLLGHVTTLADKNQLVYRLQNLKFIKNIDDTGIVIDEYVWQEVNTILSRNPSWKGITIHSPAAGQFILSGYLKTRKEAELLSNYMSLNFPYIDLLKKQIVVEEDVVAQINRILHESDFNDVTAQMVNGEITLAGGIKKEQADQVGSVIEKIKKIPGVRIVNNQIKMQTPEASLVNISEQYIVSGQSKIGNKYTVIINGRILSENDDLDGMTITKITPDQIFLEKGDVKYMINY